MRWVSLSVVHMIVMKPQHPRHRLLSMMGATLAMATRALLPMPSRTDQVWLIERDCYPYVDHAALKTW